MFAVPGIEISVRSHARKTRAKATEKRFRFVDGDGHLIDLVTP